MNKGDCIGLDDEGRAVVRTRAWSRLIQEGQGELAGSPGGPLKLAEAYMPAPVSWMMLAFSSLGTASNAQLRLTFGTLEGSVQVVQPFATAFLPFGGINGLGGGIIPATSIIVELLNPGGMTAGERISVCLAPVVWPPWAVPEDARHLATLSR